MPQNTMTQDEDVYWRAVEGRDSAYDGVFVYAVLSTRVYCRPSCPSRRPGRERVMFFDLPQTAERSGFRACLRCRPQENCRNVRDAQWVTEACGYIETHLENSLSLKALAQRFGLSAFHLQRTFKRVAGVTPRHYADACRMKLVKGRLQAGESVAGSLYEAGYGSSSRLYERADKHLGMTPATYRKGGEGVTMNYAIKRCRAGASESQDKLGWILVGATERGVCVVRLGDSAKELEDGLRAEFPRAVLNPSQPELGRWLNQIIDHLEGGARQLQVPIDVRATAFQRRVWQELTKIPYGRTRSYQEVARRLGNPKSARAVGHACGANPVAVVVPCHRAVRSDGKLGGYRWGLARKESLLKHERDRAGL
ncbi:MAG: bifunctional DNA-binding transcriptional regulator/O6-methylguanine-DNA methyltransferase Ada [Terriglobia bacterium]